MELEGHTWFITPLNVQDYLRNNPGARLPEIITTKTHSLLPDEYLESGKVSSCCPKSAGYDHFEHLTGSSGHRVSQGILRQCGGPNCDVMQQRGAEPLLREYCNIREKRVTGFHGIGSPQKTDRLWSGQDRGVGYILLPILPTP